MLLLDTSVVIRHFRREPPVTERMDAAEALYRNFDGVRSRHTIFPLRSNAFTEFTRPESGHNFHPSTSPSLAPAPALQRAGHTWPCWGPSVGVNLRPNRRERH